MSKCFVIFLTLLILLLAACGPEAPTPAPEPLTATALSTTAAEVQPSPTNALAPTPTETTVPPTDTPAPEPATATTIPTSTSEADETAVAEPDTPPTNTAVTTPSPTAAAQAETAVATVITEAAATTEGTAEPTTVPVNPPPVGSVPPVNNNNFPDNNDKAGWENRINVPAGFAVTYVGRVDVHPTSITFGPDGLLYIAQQEGNIFTMDDNGNVSLYASGFIWPTGIAFRPGTSDLYVSDRLINENTGGEAQVSIVGRGQLIGGLPCCYTLFHSAHGITFGPDGFGYVGVGARADHGEILDGSGQQDERHPLEATILRFNPDTGAHSVYARGFRNPYDHTWDANGQIWVTDNQPDFDPPEELHRVVPGAEHGYPWYTCDVCFSPPPGVEVLPPNVTFPSNSSPTGITAYLANQFPGYHNSLFVTLWSAFLGAQKIVHVGPGGTAPVNFATGFAAPIDVTVAPDGSLYVADWATGIIFKISYTG